MCKKKLPWRRFRSRPDRRGVPLLLLFTELFYGVSLFHYFAAWISKYVRAWCAEYNRASTSKKKASQKKCWNRDMIHWQNHIITLPHSLDLAFLNVASYPVVAGVDSFPSLFISVTFGLCVLYCRFFRFLKQKIAAITSDTYDTST